MKSRMLYWIRIEMWAAVAFVAGVIVALSCLDADAKESGSYLCPTEGDPLALIHEERTVKMKPILPQRKEKKALASMDESLPDGTYESSDGFRMEKRDGGIVKYWPLQEAHEDRPFGYKNLRKIKE
jgi:hypothetical protein